MVVEFVVNNYQLGAMVKTTPTHKITSKVRVDRNHTVIRYEDLTQREVEFIEKVLARKGKIIC
jgi:hypothetical protein